MSTIMSKSNRDSASKDWLAWKSICGWSDEVRGQVSNCIYYYNADDVQTIHSDFGVYKEQ